MKLYLWPVVACAAIACSCSSPDIDYEAQRNAALLEAQVFSFSKWTDSSISVSLFPARLSTNGFKPITITITGITLPETKDRKEVTDITLKAFKVERRDALDNRAMSPEIDAALVTAALNRELRESVHREFTSIDIVPVPEKDRPRLPY